MKGHHPLTTTIVLLLNLGTLLTSLSCPNCPYPTQLVKPQKFSFPIHFPKKHPPKVKPPLNPTPPSKPIVGLPPPPPPSHGTIRPIVIHSPPPSPPPPPACHVDPFKLGACVDLLGGFVHIRIGKKVKETCCPMLEVLEDIEAAFCLCGALKRKFGKISLIAPIALELLVSCDKTFPKGLHCAA